MREVAVSAWCRVAHGFSRGGLEENSRVSRVKIALAQTNPIVGDVVGNPAVAAGVAWLASRWGQPEAEVSW